LIIFADALRMGASAFEQQAARLKRKFWWQNLKVKTFKKIKIVLFSRLYKV
jgi:hypothetical protein